MIQWIKRKKAPLFILLAIIIVFAITFFTAKFLLNNTSPEYEKIYVTNDNWNSSNKDDSNESSQYPTWDATTEYDKGDRVLLDSKVYEAKWWNKGTKPDSSDDVGPWKYIEDLKDEKEINSSEETTGNVEKSDVSDGNFKIVGYFPSWKPEKSKEIKYGMLTHINYAFAIPNSDGTVKALENPDLAKEIVKNAHSAGVKVHLAVGGWEYNGTPLEATFVAATDSDDKCKSLADSILKLVDEYDFDGVDMDWEHPRTDGDSKNQYTTLLKYLREGIDKRNKSLSAAVLAGVNADGGVLYDAAGHTDEALSYLDWINVMAYDGGDGDRHSSYDFAVNSANYWLKTRKLPASKVVLGLPFYGRPSWASYEEILAADGDAYKKDVATIDGKEAYYNGIDTIVKKTKWAKDNASGVMIWEISQDTVDKDKSLLNAIYETVK